jgi:predicted site-specific integrase-resolvase
VNGRWIKLSEWARIHSVCYRTAWNRFHNGKFGDKSRISDTNTIRVFHEDVKVINEKVQIYSRVSSAEKRSDLDSQAALCEQFCASKGWLVEKVWKEIASGMNDNRPKLNKVLDAPSGKLVVLHKDRLTRFGFNYIKRLLAAKDCDLIVINENGSESEDLLKDFIAIITSFCCRLYGARRGQSKALKLKTELNS